MSGNVYRAKPVQAVQWHGESNCEQIFAFLGWEHPDDELDHSVIYLGNDTDDEVHPGDWIMRDHQGTFHAVAAVDFDATYEPVGDQP